MGVSAILAHLYPKAISPAATGTSQAEHTGQSTENLFREAF